jgi:type IV secretory pathway VirB6-like protein
MAYLLGARTAFFIVLGIVAALVALPILTSLAPPRGRR